MALRKTSRKTKKKVRRPAPRVKQAGRELVIITGMSGSGKASVLKAFEDLGYYCVDNLPVGLIPRFAELVGESAEIARTALVVDVREGSQLEALPAIVKSVKQMLPTKMIFLEASDAVILRRYSETRRPHPLGTGKSITRSIQAERTQLAPIRTMADLTINTSKFSVHELRDFIGERFRGQRTPADIMIYVTSFGFRNGVPPDSDLVFDVRFLPNPNYIPRFKPLTGKNPDVAGYVRSFPQTVEFISRISDLLVFLLPHYVREGKSYLTISFGCTGGQHRSVMMAEDITKRLVGAGYIAKVTHRDMPRGK